MSFSFTIPNTPPSSKQPTATNPGGGTFGFGQPTTASSGFSFGAPTSSSGFTFGQPLQQPGQSSMEQQPSSFSFQQQPSSSQPPGFSFGQQQPRSGTLMPQIPSAPSLFPRDTKFSELPPEFKASLEFLEKVIRENALKSLQLPPSPKDHAKLLVNFKGKLDEIDSMLSSRRDNLRQVRKRMNEYWRYAESTGQQLLASKSTLANGRVVYKVPPMVPGIDVVILERTVERLEEEVSTINRLGMAARKRLESLLAPPRPLEEVIPASVSSQHLAIAELESSLREMELRLEDEKSKYRAFLNKYRNIFQDPFNFSNNISGSR